MKQVWVLQGRSRYVGAEWLDLIDERRRKDVAARFRPKTAGILNADYRIVLRDRA